jgi:hypothetical protein
VRIAGGALPAAAPSSQNSTSPAFLLTGSMPASAASFSSRVVADSSREAMSRSTVAMSHTISTSTVPAIKRGR